MLKVIKKCTNSFTFNEITKWQTKVIYEGCNLMLAKAIFVKAKKKEDVPKVGYPFISMELEVRDPDICEVQVFNDIPKWL